MNAGTSLAELEAAIDLVLEEIGELAGPAAERHFNGAVRAAAVHGETIAAQHLRNRLLAYLDPQAFPHQPPVGLKSRMRPDIADLVERLDGALLRYFELPRRAERAGARGIRVLQVIDHLPARDRMFSHTRQICTYAAALALDPSVEAVCILASQETAPENPFHAAAEAGAEHEAGWRAELEELTGAPAPKIRIETVGRLGPVRPYGESIARILEFDPDVVFAHQGIFRSRLLPLLLSPRAPIVAVQMNQINAEPPYSDLVLAHGYSPDFSDKPTPAKWRAHSVPLIPFPKESFLDPSQLGPPSPLRVVTVLTLGRLEKGLMREDAASLKFVISFLEDYPQAVWLMVAIEDPEAFAAVIAPRLPPGVVERIRLLPVMPDLRAIYEHCHIYMHLPFLGGGNMGIAMAIAEGIPVLAREGTDGANTLFPDQIYRNPREAAHILRRLAADPDFRSQRVKRQQRKIERDHSVKAASIAFHAFLAEALASFETRRGVAPDADLSCEGRSKPIDRAMA